MAKKKQRKQAKKRNSTTAAPASKAPAQTIRRSRVSRAIIIPFVVVVAGIFVYVFIVKNRSHPSQDISNSKTTESSSPSALESLSSIDLTGMEVQVAEKIKKLQKEVQDNPQSASAWGKLAMNLDIHDLRSESIPCFKQAALLDPSDFRWPYFCANTLYEMGSPEALPLYERSLTLRPNYTAAHIRYGQALLQAKRHEEAAREFRAALQADPKSSHAYVGLALVTLTQGNVEEARGILLKALEFNPKHGEAHGLLSEVYRRLNMPKEAQQELLMSQALPKKTPLSDEVGYEMIDEGVSSYWYELRGRGYLEQGSYEAAVRELKLAVQAVHDPILHDTLGAAYLHLRKYPEAAKEHRAALALNPKSVVSMNNLASALFEMGQVNEAILWVKKAIQVQPNFAASYAQLGRLSLRLGNKAEAIHAFRSGLENAPGDPELGLRLAWLLATASDASLRNGLKAIQLAEVICKKSNYQNPECLDVLAAAYAERGEFAGATKLAQRAYQIATASRQTQLAKRIQVHLNHYEAGSPYRE